ncbi:MAG: hypothetical protein ABI972_04180 [Acidobacteriota bacterium]
MRFARSLVILLLSFVSCVSSLVAATFGTVVSVTGGASDLALDDARQRLYLVNSTRNQIEVYSIPQRRFLDPVAVEQLPLSAALSRDGKTLYVVCNGAASLVMVSTERLQVAGRISLPAKPEGVAVGYDERVLISTVGTGANNAFNVLLIYDPAASGTNQAVTAVAVAPPAPANPLLPPNNLGRPALIPRSFLNASLDGRFIMGVNLPNATNRVAFVYEAASGSVLRSRTLAGVSPVVSVSPDGSKFMAGLTLLHSQTLDVIAQQNAANANYPFPTGTNFNLQQNQGGSVFTADGGRLYTAFNIAPVQTPAARPNVSQLMLNDPDNLLIETAFQLPENATGQMVISRDGANIFALSESGFMIVPIGTASQSPIAMLDTNVQLLVNDQCGVYSTQRTGTAFLRNTGRGRMTATATVQAEATNAGAIVGPGGIGGPGGAGGGIVGGGGIVIPLPGTGGAAAATTANAPQVRTTVAADGVNLNFTFSAAAARSLGTSLPTSLFLVQSSEAINIPPAVRVYQNNRNSEATGNIFQIPINLTPAEGLTDMVQDVTRQRLYIANSGLNRVEIFDMRAQRLLPPVKVGQLPRSLALSPDALTLYVANSGGESVSIIDLDTLTVTGNVRFPALPFNTNVALITPRLITSTQRGPLVMMSNGTLWRIVGQDAVPRQFNSAVLPPNNQGVQLLTSPWTMSSSPNGEMSIVLAGNGYAYLYDALLDDFVQSRQVITTTPITGYYGPIAAGPRGQYFLVNGLVLNQALTPTANAGTTPGVPPRPGLPATDVVRPVAAVAAIGATQFARFAQPSIANANAVITDNGTIEIVDVNSGAVLRTATPLERPLSTPTGNQRSNIDGRTMSVDPSGTNAYVLTTSGLSIVSLAPPTQTTRPTINPGGVVNLASYTPEFAQGGLFSIFGRNMGNNGAFNSTPLPTVLGNSCVTLNNQPLPLMLMSDGQLNAQIPPTLAPGTYPLVIRNLTRLTSSTPSNIRVAKYAPAVFVDPVTQLPAILHPDGTPVSKQHPAQRDKRLVLYAIGLGPTTGGRVTSGMPAPADPLAETDEVKVYFGDPTIRGTEMIVEWSGLAPGYIGLYQINLLVPGARWKGEDLPVTVRIGGVSSPIKGPVVPYVTVE